MAIRFPKMHVAASVSNRILNIADGLPPAIPEMTAPPVMPDIEAESDMLTQQLATPPGPDAELPPGTDGAIVNNALGVE